MGRQMMMRILGVACVLLVSSTALPLGHEDSVALLDETQPRDAQMLTSFKKMLNAAQVGLHSDIVSQTLSDSMHEDLEEQKVLQKLEGDNERLSSGKPDLGETVAPTYVPPPVTPPTSVGSNAVAEEKLDEMAKKLKKNMKKTDKKFKQIGKNLQAQHDIKVAADKVKKQAKNALSAAGIDRSRSSELGDPSATDSAIDDEFSTSTTTSADNKDTKDAEAVKRLDAMETKLKATALRTDKNMASIEKSYEKQHEAKKAMQEQMRKFKTEAEAANKLADKDDPSSELGESTADLQDELDDLQTLQKSVTHTMDSDRVHAMVKKSNHVLEKFANTALKVINNIN